ncbi:macro domain-containing protein [Mesoaciditoga lauensis]|uniref:macro domain-containing protein n=1 Tax=Mesoaciditoga lauensis TaxID=1495039 RepID=UPI0012E05C71|nr:macro domain-containing protein [Mesoaciditoga lauensis]
MKTIKIGNTSLIVDQCDITKEKADAIVNAANSHLAHGGGVALAIARAGGDIINKESREYVQKNGPVPTGNVAVTSAGKMPSKYVIHTVGPIWGEGEEDEKLESAFYNSLAKADEMGLKSIVFPAVSSGIYGFPKERCAKIFFKTVEKFLEGKTTTLELIKMCLFSKKDYDIFAKVMEGVEK